MGEVTWSVALVTGASSGIGQEFARRLTADGTRAVLVARGEDRLRELAAELRDAHGVESEVLPADLTDPDDRRRVEARLADPDRPVDLLVNNAGFGTYGPFVELDADREEQEILLNVLAVDRLCHAAAPAMVRRGRGGIVNVSSVAAFQPLPFNATYAATKAFVSSFSEALHEELRGTGVRVVTLCPGFVRTGFQDAAGIEASSIPDVVWLDPPEVVTAALAALDRDDAVCVPGVGYRVLAGVSRLSPRWVSRKVAGTIARRI